MSGTTGRAPRAWRALAALTTPADDRGYVLADLDDGYRDVEARSGPRAARQWYRRQALTSVGPGFARRGRSAAAVLWHAPADLGRAMAGLDQDVWQAARSLSRAPVSVLAAVATLAIGIGASTTVFSVANGLDSRPRGRRQPAGGRAVALRPGFWRGFRRGVPPRPRIHRLAGIIDRRTGGGPARGRLLRRARQRPARVRRNRHTRLLSGAWRAARARAPLRLVGDQAGGRHALPLAVPLEFNLAPDSRASAFAAAVSGLTCLAIAALPAAMGAGRDIVSRLAGAHRGAGGGRGRASAVIVGFQAAASVVFLVGTVAVFGAMGQAFAADRGFATERLAVVSLEAPADVGAGAPWYEGVVEELRSRPGIEAVSLSTSLEAVFDGLTEAEVVPAGRGPVDGRSGYVGVNAVDPGYLALLRLQLVQGRGVLASDVAGAPRVAVVSQAFANRYFAALPVLGQTLTMSGVRDQAGPVPGSARARTDVASAVAALHDVIEARQPGMTFIRAQALDEVVAFELAASRLMGRLLRAASFFAVLLAFVGIYGTVAFVLARRLPELAIRVALGATARHVTAQVMRAGLVPAFWGVGLGALIGIPEAAGIHALVTGAAAFDPIAVAEGVGVMVLAAVAASVLPARRAAGIAPLALLRRP